MFIMHRTSRFAILLYTLTLLIASPASADDRDVDYDIAIDLATMLQSARAVIGANQDLINDPAIGDKGLTGAVVEARAIEEFTKAKGGAAPDLTSDNRKSRLLRAQVEAIFDVVEAHQDTINQPDIGFKGFVPAVFARLVNEEFQRKMGEEAEVMVTAPPELIRNRKARPDAWEIEAIRKTLAAPDWKPGAVYSSRAEKGGRPAFRVLVPEYYTEGCLACHGAPKGELDVTGYPKEGGEIGDLGGVISVTLFQK